MDQALLLPSNAAPDGGAGPDVSRMPPETFEIFVDDDRYAVPTLHLVAADDVAAAMAIAARMVAESPHHLGAELCRDGLRIGGLGSFAVRQLPPGGPSRRPGEEA
jgi:hypothetical protein